MIIACTAPDNQQRTAEISYVGEHTPVQESWDITLTMDKKGESRLELSAGHFAEFRNGTVSSRHLDKGVQAVIHSSTSADITILTAERAIIHPNGDLEAFGNVMLTSSDSTVLKSQYIRRSAEKKQLWTDRFITIEKPDQTIRGYGLESDDHLTNYTIFKASGEAELQQ